MKSRWDFFIECEDIRFERVHKFLAAVTAEHATAMGLPAESFDAEIVIEPDKESYDPTVEQTGKLKVTVPGTQEQTKTAAYWLAKNAADQITFSQGRVRINYGLVTGEHLPETPDEEKQIGDTPYFAQAQLIEVKPAPSFDGAALTSVKSSPLLQQFNDANAAKNPIDRYLGLFRILEDVYGPTDKKTHIAQALKSSDELFSFAEKHISIEQSGKPTNMTRNDFSNLVDKFVKARHQCAHLQRKKDFGITHGDPRARMEIEPLAKMVSELAREALRLHA